MMVKWEVAGLTEDRRGILGVSHFPTSEIPLPQDVRLDGETLRYRLAPLEELQVLSGTDRMLDHFVRIETAEDVLDFAQLYGPLHLCTHGLPWAHIYEPDEGFRDLWVADRSSCERPFEERVEDWFKWVACARGLLSASATLHSDMRPGVADWEGISRGLSPTADGGEALFDYLSSGDLGDATLMLGDFLWFWLRISDVRPKFSWDPEPRFFLQAGVFGELGIQIMQAVSHAHGLAICSGCGNAYMRKGRKPQSGRRNYCSDCGLKVARRDSQRVRRQKLRGDHGQES